MFRSKYSEPQPPVNIGKVKDKLYITINLNESTIIETEKDADYNDVEVSYYCYNSNSFVTNEKDIDIDKVKSHPEDYLFYGEDFEKLRTHIVNEVQAWMDKKVQERNYDNIFTTISYKDSSVEKFRLEAKAASDWRDIVWVTCYAILDDVVSLKRDLPTLSEIISELPTLNW